MPVEVITKAIEVFPGTRFINAFGQTESASTITMLTPEDHVIEGTPGERAIKLKRLGSIGRALGDTEVKIFDEEGSEQAVDEVGEIVARGPRVMKGYWKAEEATNSTIRNGWLYTGDIGYMDEAGISSCQAGRRTSLSGPGRTSHLSRWKRRCTRIRPSTRRRLSGCPTPSGAKRFVQ